MAKLDKLKSRGSSSVIVSLPDQSARTFEGGAGFTRDVKGELFLLGVSNMVGESTFYEDAVTRDDRFVQLVRAATREDAPWTARFLVWLRTTVNMRTASLVGAVEYAIARKDIADGPTGRYVVSSVCQRADEPAEVLAYAVSTHGRKIPMAVKRGVADAAIRLYGEHTYLKYGVGNRNWTFADVIELTHPEPKARWQSDLFKYAIDSRHRDTDPPESLVIITARKGIAAMTDEEKRSLSSEELKRAGVTWEASSSWGKMDKGAWETQIPNMGYMALLRNLRNFDEAGVSDEVAETVGRRLANPENVRDSKQLPLRFLSAYKSAPSLRWGWALERALKESVRNVPEMKGRTLVLIDSSGSMRYSWSEKGTVQYFDTASLFGVALALRNEADVFSYSDLPMPVTLERHGSVLKEMERVPFLGRGTQTLGAVQRCYSGQDRVVILTDEQTSYHSRNLDQIVPAHVPVYIFNIAGYKSGMAATGTPNRHVFGGLTDACFTLIPLLESGKDGSWPF